MNSEKICHRINTSEKLQYKKDIVLWQIIP